MRMWMIDPKMLCKKHLLGEHVELHMFVGTINKNKKLDGYKKNGLVEVHNIKLRHRELAAEMIARGMNHQSPLVDFKEFTFGVVDDYTRALRSHLFHHGRTQASGRTSYDYYRIS